MVGWDLDVVYVDDDATLPQVYLTRISTLLDSVADEVDLGRRAIRSEQAGDGIDVELRRILGQRAAQIAELHDRVCSRIETLNRALDDTRQQEDSTSVVGHSAGPHIRFEPTKIFAGRKPIHLGVVDRYFVFPAIPPLSIPLLHLIIAVPGSDELLIREKHDVFGWHYHYCDHKKRRSDVLMSFDRNRLCEDSLSAGQSVVPLCWEPHAINKAKFQAKPWRWGGRKRVSIYEACQPDLSVTPELTYKPPSKEAQDVWPI
jgi:hypothetical protein